MTIAARTTHAGVGHIVLNHRAVLLELSAFLERRLDEELLITDDIGDEAAHSFAKTSRRLVSEMRRDIDQRPWARDEVGNCLFRAARAYRTHVEYQTWWG
jgi:hypothetical protein